MIGGIVTILGALLVLFLGYKLGGVLFAVLCLIFVGYLVPQLMCVALPPQDLRKKYDAKWAVVTGSSSGIGKAIAERLAQQGVSVVMVALANELLDKSFDELKQKYKAVEFRKVGVNLGDQSGQYVSEIEKATSDIDVQLLFNNAGYVLTGFFDQTGMDQQMRNMECNATCGVRLTHVFVTRMRQKGLKGCVVFTSSAAMCQPTPFTALYGATKSFVSSFAAGLAGELKSSGIDVMAIHPSPVNSNFYSGGGNPVKVAQLDALDFFKKFVVQPETLPDRIFAALGHVTWLDIGPTAYGFRMMMKLFDYNAFAYLISQFAHLMDDFKRHRSPAKGDK